MCVQTSPPDPRQTCGRCHRLLPVSDFAWRRRASGQRDNYCRRCRAAYKQEHYALHPERYVANAVRRKRALVAERPTYRNAPPISSSSSAPGLAWTAARPTCPSWSSTISATRTSGSLRSSQSQMAGPARRDRHVRRGLCKLSSSANGCPSAIRPRGGSSTVEPRPSKAMMRVRFPSAASRQRRACRCFCGAGGAGVARRSRAGVA
jgi:hypothetical protein